MNSNEYDLALAVRDMRKRIRDLKQEEDKLRLQVQLAKRDFEELTEKHENVFQRLKAARSRAELKIITVSQRSSDKKILSNVLSLLHQRGREDDITNENLQAELVSMRQEADKASRQLRAQREQTLKTIKSLSAEWKRFDNDAHSKRQELTKLQHERVELESRTSRSCLEHAQALFGVQPRQEIGSY